MSIKITADSTLDLPLSLTEAYGIAVSPLYIEMNGVSLKDGVEVTPEEIFAHVRETGKLCSTAAVSVGDYLSFFGGFLETYDTVIHFTICSDMSSCWQNAKIAAAELGEERVYVVDSRNLSAGIGHLAMDAAELAREGLSAPEIVAEVERRREKLDVSFVLDTLQYIYKGGRCSGVAALGANMLGLKPLVEVRSGVMCVGKKYRGPSQKVLCQYVRDRLAGREDIDYRRIFITDSIVTPEIRQAVEDAVRACGPFEQVYHTLAGSTISNHCGPHCLGILYYHK